MGYDVYMDKVVLITGAAKRIGAAIARQACQQGYRVIIHCNHSTTAAQDLCTELNQLNDQSAQHLAFDLLNIDGYESFIEQCLACYGRLDVIVNNASAFYPTPLEQLTLEQWTELMAVNVKAPMFLAKYAAQQLIQNKGSIINITDIHGDRPLAGYPVYSVAKAGLIMLTKALAKELAPDVRVNAVSPGPIAWPDTMKDTLKEKILHKVLLKRQGNEDDIAKTALFLMTGSDYITGQVISVDGGRSLYS